MTLRDLLDAAGNYIKNLLYLGLTNGSAPGTPASGDTRLYAKTDKTLAYKTDAGTERVMATLDGTETLSGKTLTAPNVGTSAAASKITAWASDDGAKTSGVFVIDATNNWGCYQGPSSIEGVTVDATTNVPNGWGDFSINYYSTGNAWICFGTGKTNFGATDLTGSVAAGGIGVTGNSYFLGNLQVAGQMVVTVATAGGLRVVMSNNAPSTPAGGSVVLYILTATPTVLRCKDSSGTVRSLTFA